MSFSASVSHGSAKPLWHGLASARRLVASRRRLCEVDTTASSGVVHVTHDVATLRHAGRVKAYVIVCHRLGESLEPVTLSGGKVCGCRTSFPAHDGLARVDVSFEDDALGDDALVVVAVRRRRVWLPLLALGVVCALLLAFVLASWHDDEARRGHYCDMTPEEIADELGEEADWYSMEISVASYMEAREGDTRVLARIENTEYNHCDQKVRVYEDGHSDDVLYESGAISPGECIDEIELAHALSVGVHTLIVEFQGYERGVSLVSDEGEFLGHDRFGGSASAEVTLYVAPSDAPVRGSS